MPLGSTAGSPAWEQLAGCEASARCGKHAPDQVWPRKDAVSRGSGWCVMLVPCKQHQSQRQFIGQQLFPWETMSFFSKEPRGLGLVLSRNRRFWCVPILVLCSGLIPLRLEVTGEEMINNRKETRICEQIMQSRTKSPPPKAGCILYIKTGKQLKPEDVRVLDTVNVGVSQGAQHHGEERGQPGSFSRVCQGSPHVDSGHTLPLPSPCTNWSLEKYTSSPG